MLKRLSPLWREMGKAWPELFVALRRAQKSLGEKFGQFRNTGKEPGRSVITFKAISDRASIQNLDLVSFSIDASSTVE